MIIDINEVRELEARLLEINSIPFDEIEWVDGNDHLTYHKDLIDSWKYTGLSNCYFITSFSDI